MADSAEKKETQTDPQNPSGITTLVVANQHGALREVQKDAQGRFIKKPRPLIPTLEFTRAERKALNAASQTKEGLTEYMHAFLNLVRIAQYDGDDPKGMMAAVKAFEVVRLSALGKPAPSEQELDKLTNQPVKTIIVVAPQLMHPEIVDADKIVEKAKLPSFAEVTGVITNPKK